MSLLQIVRGKSLRHTSGALLCCVLAMCSMQSCDNNDPCIDPGGGIITEELNLPAIHSIIANGEFNIRIEQDSVQSISVTGRENFIDFLTTNVRDGIWEISYGDHCFNDFDVEIELKVPIIRSVEAEGADQIVINSFSGLDDFIINASGAGVIFQSGVLEIADQFTVRSSGAYEITAHVDAQRVDTKISGAGIVKISGSTDTQTIDMSGAGVFMGFDLMSNVCDIVNSGAGNAEVFADDVLDVKISGTGNVSYKGSPDIDSQVTGTGMLINAN